MKADRSFTRAPRNHVRAATIALAFVWLGLFAILPHLGMVVVTFLTRGSKEFVIPAFTLSNYARLFDPSFVKILWDSVKLSFWGTMLCLIVAYPFAAAMSAAGPRRRSWLMLLVIIPFWTNSLIRTYALVIILKTGGLINMLLNALHVHSGAFSLMYGDLAVFIGIVYTFLPFMVLPLYSSMEKVDRRLIDAARDLGANRFQTFRHVTLPLVMPGIVAGFMLVFLPSLGAFYIPEILGGAKHMFVGNFIKNQFLVTRDWPLGASASIVLTLLMFFLIALHSLASRKSGLSGGNVR